MISSNSILTCILIIYWFRFVTLQPLLDSIDDIIKIRPLESDEELISIAESEHENLVKRQINELKNDWPSVMDALLLEERMGRATTKDMDEDLQLHKTSDEFYLSTESNLLLKRDIDQKKHKRERRRETHKKPHNIKNNKDITGPKVWDHWGKWSTCSVTCGIGKMTRWRHCVQGGCATGEKEAQIKTCTAPAC